FMIGMAAYFFDKRNFKQIPSPMIALVGFIFFTLFSLFTWRSQALFKYAFTPVLSGVSFVFLMQFFKALPKLNFSLLRLIGTLSYSMYLVHFVFAWDISRVLNSAFLAKFLKPEIALIAAYLLSILGSLICSLAIERLVERPFIEYGRLLIQKREAV
ncbi:MAG TPA: acyltransferase family protein, partial [Phormidium sp.]